MCKRIIMVLILVSFVLISGRAYSQTSFAMFPMEVKGSITADTLEGTQAALNQILIESNRYLIVDRQKIKNILSEQVFQHSGVTDQDNIIKLGRIFNVEKFIHTILYRKEGNQFALSCNVIDVTTGQVELGKELSFQNRTPDTLGRYCAGAIIAKYPLLGKIVGSVKSDLVVNLGKKRGIKNGDRFFVARKNVVTGDDRKILFSELVRVGTIEVSSVSDDWSKTRIIKLIDGVASIKKDDIVSPEPIPNNEPLVSYTPLLNKVKKGEVILEDDMKKHQFLSVSGNEGDSYIDGKLSMVSPLKRFGPASCFYPHPFDKLQNFILEVEMAFNKIPDRNSYFKVYFRANNEMSKQFKGYALVFDSNARYAVTRDGHEQNNFFVPYSSTPNLNRGTSENKLKIVAYESKFDIYINDKYLVSFEDEFYSQGTIGLLVNIGASVSVSNISIWKAEKK